MKQSCFLSAIWKASWPVQSVGNCLQTICYSSLKSKQNDIKWVSPNIDRQARYPPSRQKGHSMLGQDPARVNNPDIRHSWSHHRIVSSDVGQWPAVNMMFYSHETHHMRHDMKMERCYSLTVSCMMPTCIKLKYILTLWCQCEICSTYPDTDDRLERQKGSLLGSYRVGRRNPL